MLVSPEPPNLIPEFDEMLEIMVRPGIHQVRAR